MSENEFVRKRLIQEFLDEIEEKLPFWLKNDPAELEGVLRELEEHFEDKIEAHQETGKSRMESTKLALTEMGNPSTIVREYKRRGTPQFYITKELFPTYMKVLRYAGLAVGAITAVLLGISLLVAALTGGNILGTFFQGVGSFVMWSIIIAAGITVIFVWLSYEGYFPEDLKRIIQSKDAKTSAKAAVRTKKPPIGAMGIEAPKKEYPKNLDKTGSLISGGIVAWVFGLLAIAQPFTSLNVLIDPLFLQILQVVGIFWIIGGTFQIVHGVFVSVSYQANKILYPLRAIISFVGIPIVAWILMNPQVFPIPVWSEGSFQIISMTADWYWLFYLIGGLILICISATAIKNIYKGAVLEEDYFLEA